MRLSISPLSNRCGSELGRIVMSKQSLNILDASVLPEYARAWYGILSGEIYQREHSEAGDHRT